MKLTFGAALTLALVAIPAYLVWWLSTRITDWFAYHSETGDMLMWSLVVALILAVFAIPAAAWGIAARIWVIRLREDERAEATARVLLAAQGAPRRPEIIAPRRGATLAAPAAAQEAPRLVHQTPSQARRRTVSDVTPTDATGHGGSVDY
jgi:hypothetical protein